VFVVILQWTTMVNHVTCILTVMIINDALPTFDVNMINRLKLD